MSDWRSEYVVVGGIRLHYTRTGGSKPPLVLAHGVTDDGLCWTPVAQALAAEYDVVILDARGHGLSDAPEHGYGPAQQAGDLAGVIAALGLERPAVLGHSMGAATTLVAAGLYLDALGAILLEDPPGWWAPQTNRSTSNEYRRAEMRERFASVKTKSRDELIAEQRAQSPGWSEAELGPWADSKLMFSLNVLELLESASETSVDWQDALGRITRPTLLMTADVETGAVLPQEGAAALQALVPQLRIEHFPGAGHNIRRDQFDRYIEVVRSFLSEHHGGRPA